MLPVFEYPAADETLFSWFNHLKVINGIDNIVDFYKAFVNPTCHEKHPYVKTDGRLMFPVLFGALGIDESMAHYYLETTCYGALAPMLSTERQIKQLNAAFRPIVKGEMLVKTPLSATPELRRCPQCMAEEMEVSKRWHYHRAHQIPGVFVCHQHGCLLSRYTGTQGHEFDDDSTSIDCQPLSPMEDLCGISAFALEMLQQAIDANMEETKCVVMTAIKELGYYAPGTDYQKLPTDLDGRGLSSYFPRGIAHYMKNSLMHVSDAPLQSTLALLYFLFSSFDNYALSMKQLQLPVSLDFLEGSSLSSVGKPKRNLIELQCNVCGERFCTTEAAVLRGWGCPQCDAKLSAQKLFERIVRVSGGGEYTLLSPFKTMEQKVLMAHSCGREYEIKPRKFIHDGTRCTCEGRHALSVIQKRLDKAGSYSLIGVEHQKSKVSVINNVKVLLRHNNCSHEQEYYAHNFLYGQRCKYCRPRITSEYLRVIIPQLSHGEYIYGGSEQKSMVRVLNTRTKEEHTLRVDYALQELSRPTPSRILPCGLPDSGRRRTEAIYSREFKKCLNKYHLFQDMLYDQYKYEKFIFLDEFSTDPEFYQDAKHALKHISSCRFRTLDYLYPGIYAWSGTQYTPEEMLTSKYCRRRNIVIGYTYGYTFAHELGLIATAPEKLYFVTAKESQPHGRSLKKVKGVNVHVRGSRSKITNDNYKVLQFLDFLPNLGQYIDCTKDVAFAALRNYAQLQGITKDDTSFYLDLYPDLVPAIVEKILGQPQEDEQ